MYASRKYSVTVLILSILVLAVSCQFEYKEPPKDSPTVLQTYFIDNLCSQTFDDGRIVFSWTYCSENFDHLDVSVIDLSDNSSKANRRITDTGETELEIAGEAGKLYAYSFIPYGKDGSLGKTFTGTRYVLPEGFETALPRLVITTSGYEWPDCDYVDHPKGSAGAGLANNTYVAMNIALENYDGSPLYESASDYSSKIKIRGNTSAYGDKKPYKIKLGKKADLISYITGRTGNQYKDKEWLLLTNGTTLNNVIGFAVNEYLGIEFTPAYAYVELFVNGDYRGVYMLVESVKQGNTSGD